MKPPLTILGKTRTALALWPTVRAAGLLAYSFLRPVLTLRSISAAVAARAVVGSIVAATRTKTSPVRSVILFKSGVLFMRVALLLLSSNGDL